MNRSYITTYKVRNTKKYKDFRLFILKRDNYKCVFCGKKTNEIHHLKSRKLYPELCFVSSNVVAICRSCHLKIERRASYNLTEKTKKKISMATKGKNNPSYKHGLYCTKRYCIICGKLLSRHPTKTGKCVNCCRIGNQNAKKKR